MFFAIHNPKLEEYINRKSRTNSKVEAAHILKNMLRRRSSISTIVFQLFEYANIKNGAATYVYPVQNNQLIHHNHVHNSVTSTKTSQNIGIRAHSIIKSFQAGHLKTTAVHIRKLHNININHIDVVYKMFIDTIASPSPSPSPSPSRLEKNVEEFKLDEICEKRNKIKYARKDIIFLALAAYMHIKEEDINTRAVFISLTEEELENIKAANFGGGNDTEEMSHVTSAPPSQTKTQPKAEEDKDNDEKYKYLLS
jgi:hypothetical protein